MPQPPRLRALVLLLALAGVQLLTVGAALAGEPSCLCDETMCVHHPGGHGSHGGSPRAEADHHGAHRVAPRVETPPAAHCAYQPAAAPRECSMRGCDHQSEDSLPVTTLASLPDPTAIARPKGVSVLASGVVGSLLDRSSQVEPPPPRFLAV